MKINQFFNDPVGSRILRTPAAEVGFPLNEEIKEFLQDLKDTLEAYKEDAVGLSANQIWDVEDVDPPSIFIARVNNEDRIFINPSIKGSGNKIALREGCMSMIGRAPKNKKRDKNVIIEYQDIDGEKHIEKYSLFNARVIQHEMDHIKGKVI